MIAIQKRQHCPPNRCGEHRPDGDNSGQFGRQYPHVGDCTGICSAFGEKAHISRVFEGVLVLSSADGGLLNNYSRR